MHVFVVKHVEMSDAGMSLYMTPRPTASQGPGPLLPVCRNILHAIVCRGTTRTLPSSTALSLSLTMATGLPPYHVSLQILAGNLVGSY